MQDKIDPLTALVVVLFVTIIVVSAVWNLHRQTDKPAPNDIPYVVKHMDPLEAGARQTYALERIAASLERMEDRQAEAEQTVGVPMGGR